LCVAQDILRS